MGDYNKVMLEFEGKMSLAYQKSDRSSLFVTKPAKDNSQVCRILFCFLSLKSCVVNCVQLYNWGVSRAPLARWGYLRSAYGGLCPAHSGDWRVYQPDSQLWLPDYSLTLTCQ